MEAVANEITCNITRAIVNPPKMDFIYLSPILLENKEFETQHEGERLRQAEKVAMPARILVKAGQLKLRIFAETVSGSVWMKGYDKIESAYVLYTALFFGRKANKLEPMLQIGK